MGASGASPAPPSFGPREEARRRIGNAYEARVLEPSPPAVTDPPWFADDPVARGVVPPDRRVVTPVPSGDLTWEDLVAGDAALAAWCGERWLAAWPRLPATPAVADLAATRGSWHRVAEHVLAPVRHAATGRIGLRYTRDGIGTPWFRVDGEEHQVCLDGGGLAVRAASRTQRVALTTLRVGAAAAGTAPGLPAGLYTAATPLEPDAPLPIDPDAAAFLGAWFGFACSVLEELRVEAGAGDAPGRVQLWPEHLDLAVELGDAATGARGTFGASPGDDQHQEPYLYVTHWHNVPADPFWDDPHFAGASLPVGALGTGEQRAAALNFLRRGRDALARAGGATPR